MNVSPETLAKGKNMFMINVWWLRILTAGFYVAHCVVLSFAATTHPKLKPEE